MRETQPPRSGLADPNRRMTGELFQESLAGGELVVRANHHGVGLSAGSSSELVVFLPWDYADDLGASLRGMAQAYRRQWGVPKSIKLGDECETQAEPSA